MDRREFLTTIWKPYPALSGALFSLPRWQQREASMSGEVWLGGRLRGPITCDEGFFQLQLEGQGHTLLVQTESLHLILETSGVALNQELDLCPLLVPGDRVALRMPVEGDVCTEAEVRASRVDLCLLSPAQAELSPPLLTRQRAESWQAFLAQVRSFFQSRGLVEVHTPSLVVCPGMEPHLEPFATTWELGRWSRELYLPTSPELHLKKMLAQGWTDIFEIKPCYRNGEISEHHEPEFFMLEWYRAYADLNLIAKDLTLLLEKLHKADLIKGALGPVEKHTVQDLFEKFVGLRLTPATSQVELRQYAVEHGLDADEAHQMDWDDLFHWLFLVQVEPRLAEFANPLIVYNYPPSQAALARLNSEGWADRFELYWRGLEIANAFNELNDPDEQERRLREELDVRKKLGRTPVPIDEEFLKALNAGLPPTGGIALGLERLFMAAQGIARIQELKSFSAQGLKP